MKSGDILMEAMNRIQRQQNRWCCTAIEDVHRSHKLWGTNAPHYEFAKGLFALLYKVEGLSFWFGSQSERVVALSRTAVLTEYVEGMGLTEATDFYNLDYLWAIKHGLVRMVGAHRTPDGYERQLDAALTRRIELVTVTKGEPK